MVCPDSLVDIRLAALLTKFKPVGAEKAVLRPYTPTSDEGNHWLFHIYNGINTYHPWQTSLATSTLSSRSTPTDPCLSTCTA